jgi:hypothetical protein
MPTAPINTYGAQPITPFYNANGALMIEAAFGASLTLAKGTVIGELTATPGEFKAYATGNADGSETAKAILPWDITTDGSKNITIGGGEFGVTYKTIPVYVSGYFKTTELTGLDAAGMADFAGHLVSGVLSNGILCIPGGGGG